MAVKLNWITIRDANLPLSIDEFSEKFADCTISFFINFFSSYDRVKLNKESHNLTMFMSPLVFIQMTTLAQSATNLVAQVVKIMFKILAPHLCNQAKSFLDDKRIKKPKTTYNNKELTPKIRQYVLEHIQNLDKILANLEEAGVTIAGAKSQFC